MKLYLNYLFAITLTTSLLFISGCNRNSDEGGKGRVTVPNSEINDKMPNTTEDKEEGTKEKESKEAPSSRNDSQSIDDKTPTNESGAQKNPTTNAEDNKANNKTPSSPGQGSSGTGSNTGTDESTTPDNSAIEGAASLPSIPNNYDYDLSSEVEDKILSLINAERSNAGVVDLTANGTLRSAARYKANEMLQYDYFSHNSPYSNQPSDIAKAFGHNFNTFGENIFTISSSTPSSLRENISAENIVAEWMASEGHKSNILNSNYRKTGIGVVIGSNGKCYISQMFSD